MAELDACAYEEACTPLIVARPDGDALGIDNMTHTTLAGLILRNKIDTFLNHTFIPSCTLPPTTEFPGRN